MTAECPMHIYAYNAAQISADFSDSPLELFCSNGKNNDDFLKVLITMQVTPGFSIMLPERTKMGVILSVLPHLSSQCSSVLLLGLTNIRQQNGHPSKARIVGTLTIPSEPILCNNLCCVSSAISGLLS